MKHALPGGAMTVCVAVLVTACGLLAYDRFVVRPAQVIGVVDVAEIYRLKEAEFAALVTRGGSDADRQQAMDLASNFSRRLPRALEELPADCRCLVVLKSALAGPSAHTLDLTALLKTKVDER
jgi:hypothetical protein